MGVQGMSLQWAPGKTQNTLCDYVSQLAWECIGISREELDEEGYASSVT